MTQQIPQTKAGDVLVLEISISTSPTQHRWDLWYMLCILVHYVNQAQLASYCFLLKSTSEVACRDV